MQVEGVLKLHIRNDKGGMAPLAEVVTPEWSVSPLQFNRYNGYRRQVDAQRLRFRTVNMEAAARAAR
ncbi:hypothetical protein EDC40_1079 [Aminobacter aminovorans]|nr:efflux RND transporter permease subunit [Aminobacter aminovorans]TCS24810.1 hypothetical protein EDC40_1079 [Aminobacter aminovorans]